MATASTESTVDRDQGPEAALRAGTYALLARLLNAPPDRELLARLERLQESGSEAGPMASAWGGLKLAAGRATPESASDEFQALFIGLGRGELVPYASWYLTGFLMEKPLAALRLDLQRLGFERQSGVAEPEDHAAALCDVMAMLTVDPAQDLQRQFFQQHLGSWMHRFFNDLARANSGRFYRAVGCLGEEFIQMEQRYLSMPV